MIKDMTEGSPSKIILKFAMPMLLSMLFQQLYNVVDSIVAGKFIGVDALASVGASYPITMLFIAIATGASVGCCIVISQLFGAKRLAKMNKSAISTAIISLVSLSIILMLIGVIICNPLMRLIVHPCRHIRHLSTVPSRVHTGNRVPVSLQHGHSSVHRAAGESARLLCTF